MVELLLKYDANPNGRRRTLEHSYREPETVWHWFLASRVNHAPEHYHGRRRSKFTAPTMRAYHESWCEIALLLLSYGADAVSSFKYSNRRRMPPGPRSTLHWAVRKLCPERDLQKKLVDALTARGAEWLLSEQELDLCSECSERHD